MSWEIPISDEGADEKLYRDADAASWVPSCIPCCRRGLFFFLAGSNRGCIAISRKVPGFEGVNCGDGVLTGIACAKECSLELDNICAND